MEYRPGTHLLMDLNGARHLTDAGALRDALTAAAQAAGATVLGAHFHSFPDRAGITGVVLLAESHISIHTWPEIGFAAIDIFMCGAAEPHRAAEALRQRLRPESETLTEVQRNQVSQPSL
ncbi:adenosylmethionine decarboxylase [Pseudooceanicola sp. 216_PA32_1]|uniref:Adenosylmethionine decarboxylase n=1 Tax=Pseudooceanicola pacificus TaxID=2676438 RepID=A0A844W8A8_9RHOB|nr:adenosylmethionine decarboxylase [Pseudooceanicola pacificus]MWB76678.1 adenosylmethionine decarboxylase [Pseudooceanicola pacificus]